MNKYNNVFLATSEMQELNQAGLKFMSVDLHVVQVECIQDVDTCIAHDTTDAVWMLQHSVYFKW